MKSARAQWIFCFLVGLGVSLAFAAPVVLNENIYSRGMIQADLLDAGQAMVGARGISTDGGLILYGDITHGISLYNPALSAAVSIWAQDNNFVYGSGWRGAYVYGENYVVSNGYMDANTYVLARASSGNNAFAVNANGARVDFGAGASDYASSDGTTVTFAGPTSSAGNVNTGGVFTRSGVEIAQPTITSATSIGTILTANFELGGIRFQTPTTFTRFGQTTLVTGVGAGNLTIEVYNVTGAAVVCTRTLACTLALGMSSANCAGTVAAADDVVLRIDASACTTSPVMSLTAMYR